MHVPNIHSLHRLVYRLLLLTIALIVIITMMMGSSHSMAPAQAAGNGTTEQVSVSSSGSGGNSESRYSSISADGRYVAFGSAASNLVTGDVNGWSDIFVFDRQTHSVERVSVSTDGQEANHNSGSAAISADGQHVTFSSPASNLVSNDTNNAEDVFIHDRSNGTTKRISVASDGSQANGYSYSPDISSDGRFVVYESMATNLALGENNPYYDIFVYDQQTAQTQRVSVSSTGQEGNSSSANPAISADGRYVVFQSVASNLGGSHQFLREKLFLHDLQTGITTFITIGWDGTEVNGDTYAPDISGDGRYITFQSVASNLVPGDTNDASDIFVYDTQNNLTERISEATDSTQANSGSASVALSTDGRYVAFASSASNLISNDVNGTGDIFLHDRQTGVVERISVSSNGEEGNEGSFSPSISSNGQYISFDSSATNFVIPDTNRSVDVFIRDREGSLSPTPTSTSTATPTNTPTATPSNTPTNTATSTPTNIAPSTTATPTSISQPTPIPSPTVQAENTECGVPVCVDTDQDSIWDNWESQGSGIDANHDGQIDLDLYALGARPNRRDVFVEIDWMPDIKPSTAALEEVRAAFAHAPVWDEDNDFDGTRGQVPNGIQPGVNLIYQDTTGNSLGEEVPNSNSISFGEPREGMHNDIYDYRFGSDNVYVENGRPQWHGVLARDRICGIEANKATFGTQEDRRNDNCVNIIHAKSLVFRYALYGHTFSDNNKSSGIATVGGYMLFIARDLVRAIVGNDNLRVGEAGTFMHELGHTLGLEHWGGQNESLERSNEAYNCKPNYFSVMNYYYQFPFADPDQLLDYSSWNANSLNEKSLDEREGVHAPTTRKVLFGTVFHNKVIGGLTNTNEPINWNRSLGIDADLVSADVNGQGLFSVGWETDSTCLHDSPGQLLTGHDDWKSLDYNFLNVENYPYSNPGVSISSVTTARFGEIPDEPTVKELRSLGDTVDYDDDGLANNADNCPAVSNPDQVTPPEGTDCGVSLRTQYTVHIPLVTR